MGDEISRIISDQRNLEHRYAELVSARAMLTGISQKEEYMQVKNDIKGVA